VSITTPKVSITSLNEIREQYPLPYLIIEVGYIQGVTGKNMLAIRESDALIIADLMMGRDGLNPPSELNELYMSAVTEAMNQMMGSTATSLSTVFKKKVDISPPRVNLIDLAVDSPITESFPADAPIVSVNFRMEVEDLIDSELMQIVSMSAAKEMVDSLLTPMSAPPVSATIQPKPANKPSNVEQITPSIRQPAVASSQPQPQPQPVQTIQHVQPAQFMPLKPVLSAAGDANLGIIMDVPMQVTVELGRTRKLIRDILELTQGSVVELDKLAGEPVDILVNGKLIAKGEVVVIDENFGVRVSEIVGHMERIGNLQ
jgi:flagellar motor switch protein FliN/FliY